MELLALSSPGYARERGGGSEAGMIQYLWQEGGGPSTLTFDEAQEN